MRAARRRRGLRRRRRAGDRDVRLRRRARAGRSTWSPAPATSTSSPPSGCSRAWSASTPRPGPTEIAILADDTADAGVRRRRPDQPGRARPAGRRGAGHRLASALADAVEAELDKQVAATKHTERIRTALAGQQSGIVLVDDLEQGLDVVNAYAAEHLEIHTARRAARAPPGSATPARSSSAPYAPVSLGDYCAGSNHVLPTGGCACHSSGLSVRAFLQVGARRRLLPRRRCARSPTTSSTLAEAEDLPGHGAAVRGPARGRLMAPMTFASAARRAARHRAVRRAAARRAGAAQRQREPYPPSAEAASPTSRAAVAAAARDAEPLPRPRVHRAARRRWPATSRRRRVAARARAGVGGQRLQRGDAAAAAGLRRAGPHGARLRADVLDVPGVRPRHRHRLGGRPPRGRLHARPRRSPRRWSREHRPDVVLLPRPTTRPAPRCRPRRSSTLCEAVGDGGIVVVDEAYGEFRRAGTPSALELLPSTATWWSPAP